MSHIRFTPRAAVVFLLVVGAFLLIACGGGAPDSGSAITLPPHTPSPNVSFNKDIMPILQDKCINCHGGEKTSKGLNMKTFASLMAGSQNGAVVVAGNPAQSKMIQSLLSGTMPKRGSPLPVTQIETIMDWVTAGAQNN